jgi:hypothetical protein
MSERLSYRVPVLTASFSSSESDISERRMRLQQALVSSSVTNNGVLLQQ